MEKTKLLILRITNRCNLACEYCYAAGCGTSDMSLETAVKAIDLLAKPGEKLKIQFTGGEPLLCQQLMQDIFQYVNTRGIQTSFSLQTNGTLLTKEACNLLKKMRCGVGVSLDGIGEANRLRCYSDKTPAFYDTLDGIHNLARAGIRCNLNAVVSSASQGKLSELVELAGFLENVGGIGLDMFRPIGRGERNDYAPDIMTLADHLKAMLVKQKELADLGVVVRIKELEKVRTMLENGVQESCYCYAQTGDSFAVNPKGDIYPCSSFVGMADMCMGNVESGFETDAAGAGKCISYGSQVRVPGMDSQCSACAYAAICRGGCPAGRKACGGKNETDCCMHRTIIEYCTA